MRCATEANSPCMANDTKSRNLARRLLFGMEIVAPMANDHSKGIKTMRRKGTSCTHETGALDGFANKMQQQQGVACDPNRQELEGRKLFKEFILLLEFFLLSGCAHFPSYSQGAGTLDFASNSQHLGAGTFRWSWNLPFCKPCAADAEHVFTILTWT